VWLAATAFPTAATTANWNNVKFGGYGGFVYGVSHLFCFAASDA